MGYPKPLVWFAVLKHHEDTSFKEGAPTFGEACKILYQRKAQGYDEAYILLTIRI